MILWTIKLILSSVFFLSSLSKLFKYRDFIYSIYEFGIKKSLIRNIIAPVIISTELFTAISISSGFYMKVAFLFSMIMMSIFIIMFVQALWKKKILHCNCFGEGNKPTDIKRALIRNMIFFLISAYGFMEFGHLQIKSLTSIDLTIVIYLASITLFIRAFRIINDLRIGEMTNSQRELVQNLGVTPPSSL